MAGDDATRTKKLVNAPEDLIPEMIEGLVAAHPELLRVEGPTGRAVVARDGPREGKVGIVIGGGSGHEPAFAGYVGRGLADAAAVGNVFASPSPAQVEDAARAADGGAGVVFLYGNYTGDVMNFDMAAERCAADGIEVRSVAVTDDAASAPPERASERRGIAGDFFVFKVAGAAADAGMDLAAVEAAARRANAATRSMGVALSACSMPQTAVPNFTVAPDRMELGMGLHGEPGVESVPLEPADAVADRLLAPIARELGLGPGARVAVLVNGLGATSQLELYILYRRAAAELGRLGVAIEARWVGEYATSLEMAGASLTVMRLDDELAALLARPCRTAALAVGDPAPPAADGPAASSAARGRARPSRAASREEASAAAPLLEDGPLTPDVFRAMLRAAGARIERDRDWLSGLDGEIGDGDHGITMDIGWKAILRALDGAGEDATVTAICTASGDAFLDAVGASSGPLYATAFRRAGEAVADRRNLDAAAVAAWIEGVASGIRERGGAAPGEKTMVDAWAPAAEAAAAARAGGADVAGCLVAARDAAREGYLATAGLRAARGRAAKLGERAVGHVDPGAASAWAMLDAMAAAFAERVGPEGP